MNINIEFMVARLKTHKWKENCDKNYQEQTNYKKSRTATEIYGE